MGGDVGYNMAELVVTLSQIFSSIMEGVCAACSKGLFGLANFVSDTDALKQYLVDHKLVPETRKCPKCECVLWILPIYRILPLRWSFIYRGGYNI